MAVIYICAGRAGLFSAATEIIRALLWDRALATCVSTLADDSAIKCLPFIGFSFSVIGHPAAGVIKKPLGEVDPERPGSGPGGQEGRGVLLIIEFERRRVVKHLTAQQVDGLVNNSPEDVRAGSIGLPSPRKQQRGAMGRA